MNHRILNINEGDKLKYVATDNPNKFFTEGKVYEVVYAEEGLKILLDNGGEEHTYQDIYLEQDFEVQPFVLEMTEERFEEILEGNTSNYENMLSNLSILISEVDMRLDNEEEFDLFREELKSRILEEL